jgi:hypothetical protein
MSDYNFDLGSFDDLAAVDMGNLADIDFGSLADMDFGSLGNFDFSDFDLGSLSDEAAFGFDPSILGGDEFDAILANLGGGNVGGGDGMDFRDFNLNEMSDEAAYGFDPSILGGDNTEIDVNAPLLTPGGIDESFTDRLNDFDYKRYIDYLSPEGQAGAEKYQEVLDKLDSGPANDTLARGEVGPWQQSGSDRIMINEDGTGIGVNENGEMYTLSESEVDQMIKNKQLNTYESGYNTLAGGDKYAPGGGRPVTLNNGKNGTLMPGGKVIDNNTGKTIGTVEDVKDEPKKPEGPKPPPKGGGGGGGSGSSENSLSSLLPLLLMMMMMNKDKGGGGSSTVIPGLTATQRQTPYTQQQRAPGYRPGQGGITYFDQTQYAPKMAAGGGISRLLRGPGDGVSDSIPAVITNGMSRGGQPAKVARGEYIIDARTVAALGNGSTDAGAERLDKMRKNILRDDRKAGVGKDSKAYRHLLA